MDGATSDDRQSTNRKLFGRRGLLLGAVGAAGAAMLGKTERAEAGASSVELGVVNHETTPTTISNTVHKPAFIGTSNDGGYFPNLTETVGLVGASPRLGVFGAVPDVLQISSTVLPIAPPGRIGVLGSAPPASSPETTSAVGVFGTSAGIGVLGNSAGTSPPGVGVRAEHTADGVALEVLGKAVFSTAGNSSIPAHADQVQVSEPLVGPDSVVLVTFTSNPGAAMVDWVERKPGTGFVLHLSRIVTKPVKFSYVVVEGS
jgi:hypothetical protein